MDLTTPPATHTVKLSARERQLLELASKGFTDHAIAHSLDISVPTVATYWGRIRIKMGPLSRPELVAHYVQVESNLRIESLRKENEALRARITAVPGVSPRMHPTIDSMLELIRQAPDAVLFFNQLGEVMMGNEAASKIFACPVADFPKKRVEDFIPPDLRAVHRQHHDSFFTEGGRKVMGDHAGVAARRMNGELIRIEASVSIAETEDGPIAVVIAREVF